jgi:hypothetical protein
MAVHVMDKYGAGICRAPYSQKLSSFIPACQCRTKLSCVSAEVYANFVAKYKPTKAPVIWKPHQVHCELTLGQTVRIKAGYILSLISLARLKCLAQQGCAVNLHTASARAKLSENFQLAGGFLAGPSDGANGDKGSDSSLSRRPVKRSPAHECVMPSH